MDKMAVTRRGLLFILGGLLLMVVGYILMTGGAPVDPQVFNYEMFNTRRLVIAPLFVLAGIGVIVFGIFAKPGKDEEK